MSMLDRAGVKYEKLYVEENEQKARELGLRQAPTLIVYRDGKADKFVNISGVKEYLNRM